MGRETSKTEPLVDTSTATQLVQASVRDLFHRLGCPLRKTSSFPPPSALCSVATISFTIPQQTGTLSIAANRKLIVDSQGLQSFCRDWVGELSNLIMGGIKFELLQIGADELHLGTPKIVPLALVPAKTAGLHLRFAAPGHVLDVVLDAAAIEILEQLARTATGPTENDDVLEAGELVFF